MHVEWAFHVGFLQKMTRPRMNFSVRLTAHKSYFSVHSHIIKWFQKNQLENNVHSQDIFSMFSVDFLIDMTRPR